jgi:FecR protein
MMGDACPRLFEVEALRDGRLGGAQQRNFERHLVACPVCAREAETFDRLGDAARADTDDGRADELRVWRERTRLLAAFDRALVSRQRAGSPRRRRYLPVAAALAIAGVMVFGVARRVLEPARVARAEVHAGGSTVWSRRIGTGNRDEIALERGLLWIHVDHSSAGGPLLVVLPDGELEDVGTTFTVSADGGHTTRVAVEQGRVVLRLRGLPAVDIRPGGVWLPAEPTAPIPPTTASPAPEPTTQSDQSPPPRASRPPRVHSSPAMAVPDPLVGFRAAMGALRAGDNRRAATAFASFLVEHPRDPMAEDAAYLRVIALHRIGAGGDVKRAAKDYLQRFPTGFRRSEIENLLVESGDM